jgi:hypothetical protein
MANPISKEEIRFGAKLHLQIDHCRQSPSGFWGRSLALIRQKLGQFFAEA